MYAAAFPDAATGSFFSAEQSKELNEMLNKFDDDLGNDEPLTEPWSLSLEKNTVEFPNFDAEDDFAATVDAVVGDFGGEVPPFVRGGDQQQEPAGAQGSVRRSARQRKGKKASLRELEPSVPTWMHDDREALPPQLQSAKRKRGVDDEPAEQPEPGMGASSNGFFNMSELAELSSILESRSGGGASIRGAADRGASVPVPTQTSALPEAPAYSQYAQLTPMQLPPGFPPGTMAFALPAGYGFPGGLPGMVMAPGGPNGMPIPHFVVPTSSRDGQPFPSGQFLSVQGRGQQVQGGFHSMGPGAANASHTPHAPTPLSARLGPKQAFKSQRREQGTSQAQQGARTTKARGSDAGGSSHHATRRSTAAAAGAAAAASVSAAAAAAGTSGYEDGGTTGGNAACDGVAGTGSGDGNAGGVAAGGLGKLSVGAKRKAEEPPAQKSTTSRSRSWMPEEDELVRKLVREHGLRKWAFIAGYLQSKTQKQVYARWRDYLQPGLSSKPWTRDEQKRLLELQASVGNQWAVLAKMMPGRSPNAIKNRFHATKRKLERYNRKVGGGATAADVICGEDEEGEDGEEDAADGGAGAETAAA